jgi:hypothetical protein
VNWSGEQVSGSGGSNLRIHSVRAFRIIWGIGLCCAPVAWIHTRGVVMSHIPTGRRTETLAAA